VSLRAWIDKLTGPRPTVEDQPVIPDPYNPPLPELTPEQEEVRAGEQRKLLDKQDAEDNGPDDLGDDRYVTP
jgi:hypothetical protein